MSFDERYESGEWWEFLVESWLKKNGWKTERFCVKDSNGKELPQHFVYMGRKLNHPDITIEKTTNNIVIKSFVEVKSFSKPFGNRILKEFDPEEKYVYISKKSFDDYIEVQSIVEIPVYIVFVIETNSNFWYWRSLDKLDKNKFYVEDVFKKGSSNYFWKISDLKRINRNN